MTVVSRPSTAPESRPVAWQVLPPEADLPARLSGGAGRVVPLHNRDAGSDATRLAALVDGALEVVVIGLYPVALLPALLATPGRRVLVIESDPAWARWVRASPIGRAALETQRAAIHVVGDPAVQLWRHFTTGTTPPAVLTHPVLRREWPAAVDAALAIATRAFAGASANEQARVALAPIYLTHTLSNVAHVARSRDVSAFAGAWAGRPAVLLGAGPSLDEALPVLRDRQDEVLVIATDTALRPALAAGVQPHICVAVDASAANGRHLTDLAPPDRTWLFAEASVLPVAVRAFGSRVVLFRVADHHPWPWLASAGVSRSTLRAWGSVLTTAFDLAITLGASPLLFVGADLAYTGDRPYCRGITFERDWEALREVGYDDDVIRRSVMRGPLIDEPDIFGQPTRTAAHLVAFRDWLVEHSAACAPGTIINATGAGILHGPGLRQVPLVNALPRGGAPIPSVGEVAQGQAARDDSPGLAAAIADVLWGVRAHDPAADALLASWQAFATERVSRDDLVERLSSVAIEAGFPRRARRLDLRVSGHATAVTP